MSDPGSMSIVGTADQHAWMEVLERSRQHDFYQLPQYHRVAEQHGEGTAQLFVYREADYTIGLPLLLRPIDPADQNGWHDATSVYGYGGPVSSHDALPADVVANFQAALTEELSGRRVVAVFSRLHPLIDQRHILAGLGECPAHGQTISIDLTQPDAAQRAQYSKSCRKTLRQLGELGFVGLHDRQMRYLPEFVAVYLETMRRTRAHSSYLFDKAYFEMLVRELDGIVQLFVVLNDGEVAAATICTIRDGIVQDHLGGTRDAFLRFSPDRLIVDTERLWATEIGARVFHLGGGVGGQEDSVFSYKAQFSKRRHTFRTWRWIVRTDVYEQLVASETNVNAGDDQNGADTEYFPAYRRPTGVVAAPDDPSPSPTGVRYAGKKL
jgi:Acetyltransferase (GNAT) domain